MLSEPAADDAWKGRIGLVHEAIFADFPDLSTSKVTTTSFPTPRTSSSYDDANIETRSVYAQDEWKFADTITGYLGVRYYDISAKLNASSVSPLARNDDQRWLGTTGLVWTPLRNWSMRASFAQGYTYPSLTQLFVTSAAGGNTTVGNPALAAESANSVELGSRYENGRLLMDATLFTNRSRDFIDKQTVTSGSPGVPGVITWANVHRARTTGLELLLEYDTARHVTAYVSGAMMRREFDFGNYATTDSGTPALAGRIGLRTPWRLDTWHGDVDAFVRAATSSDRRDDAGEIKDWGAGYGTLNAAITASQSKRLTIRVALSNLLDQRYRPVDEIPGAGRSIEVIVSASLP